MRIESKRVRAVCVERWVGYKEMGMYKSGRGGPKKGCVYLKKHTRFSGREEQQETPNSNRTGGYCIEPKSEKYPGLEAEALGSDRGGFKAAP